MALRCIEFVPLARLLSVGAVASTPTRRAAIGLALLVAWVATIRKAGVTTIGATEQGTLAVGAVVVVINTSVAMVGTTAIETRHHVGCKVRQIRIHKIATLSHGPRKVGLNHG